MNMSREQSRRFWLLWFGSVCGFLAGMLAKIALPVFAAGNTGSPLVVSAVVLAFTGPRLVLGLPMGLLVDRLDRRRLLAASYLLRFGGQAALAIAALQGTWVIPVLLVAALVIGTTEIVDEPSVTALVPMIVRPNFLDAANRRFVAAEIAVDIVSQPLGGLLVGVSLLLAVTTGSAIYLAGIACLLLIAGTFRPARTEHQPLLRDVVAGLQLVWSQPVLRVITLMAGVINGCWTAWTVVFVLHALAPGPMGLSEWRYGLLLGADGIGGALGVLSAGFVLSRFGRRWAIGLNIVGNALMFLTPLLTVNVWVTSVAIAIGGFGGPLWGIVTRTMQQRLAPNQLIGRVSSAYRFIGFGANAIGTVAGGLIAQVWGLDPVFLITGSLTLLMLVPFHRVVTARAMRVSSDAAQLPGQAT